MECLLRESHHLMAFCPWIQFQVHQGRRYQVGHWSHGCGCVVDAAAAIEHTHTLTHELLLRIGCPEIVKLLAPQVDLVAKVHLYGAECLTTVAECAGADIAGVLLWITEHTEVDADRPGNE